MICPQCKAEYRRGFAVCADCDVPLVESTAVTRASAVENGPPADPGDPNEDPFCSFWKGTDLRVCTEICGVLDESGIPHKTIRRQDHMFNLNNQVPYEVGVPASLYEKAELAVKDAFGTDSEGAEDAVYEWRQKKLLPDAPEYRETTQKEATYSGGPGLAGAYAEDATALVWQGEDRDTREMIAMSLPENNIFSRWEEQGTAAEVYVLPEEEERAKEIVREILEGQAPE